MELLDIMLRRRSVRQYKKEEIPEERAAKEEITEKELPVQMEAAAFLPENRSAVIHEVVERSHRELQ